MKKFIGKHLNTILIVGTLLIVLGIGAGNNELYNIWQALGSISFKWLGLCVFAYMLHMLLDALTLHYFLRRRESPVSLRFAIYVSLMGLYYADVTPGASGGQPMQIYYLKKRGVPIGISTSALTVKFFCFQLMLLLLGGVAWIWKTAFVGTHLWGKLWFLAAGFIFNAFSVIMVLLMAINKRMVRFFIALFLRIGYKLHICKDVHKSTLKWEGILGSFHASVTLIRKRPGELLVLMLISGIQVLTLMGITVCIYYAFPLTGFRVSELVTMALLLYVSAAYTPLPGGSGAQEGGFLIYFRGIFPTDTIFISMLIWRFFTFYLNLLLGIVASVFHGAFEKRRERVQAGRPLPIPIPAPPPIQISIVPVQPAPKKENKPAKSSRGRKKPYHGRKKQQGKSVL